MHNPQVNPAPAAPNPNLEQAPLIVNINVDVETVQHGEINSNMEFQLEDDRTVALLYNEFAFPPALATKEKILNYSNVGESRIFKSGTAKLLVDINGTPENLNLVYLKSIIITKIKGPLDK